MNDFAYIEIERFNISSDLKAPLVSKEQHVDVNNKIHGIQLGNKCVPASRFKLKTRQTIKNMQGLNEQIEINDLHSFEKIRWSDQIYTFKDVKKLMAEENHLLAKLETGFSDDNLELARSQILLIIDYGVEKRASVIYENGCTISVPLDYGLPIIYAGKEYGSFDDLKSMKLPLQVELKSYNSGAPFIQISTFASIKEYIYIKACTVVYGWVDQSELLILPELSQIEFIIGTGFLNANEKEWYDYKNMLQRSTRHLKLQSAGCYSNILFENERTNNNSNAELNNSKNNEIHNYSNSFHSILDSKQEPAYINVVKSQLLNNNNKEDKENNENNNGKLIASRTYNNPWTDNARRNEEYELIEKKKWNNNPQIKGKNAVEAGGLQHENMENLINVNPRPNPIGASSRLNPKENDNNLFENDPNLNKKSTKKLITMCVSNLAEVNSVNAGIKIPKPRPNQLKIMEKEFPVKNAPLHVNGKIDGQSISPQPDRTVAPIYVAPASAIKNIFPVKEKPIFPAEYQPRKLNGETILNDVKKTNSNKNDWSVVNGTFLDSRRITVVEDIPADISGLSTINVSDCFLLLGLQQYCKQIQYLKIDGKSLCAFDEKDLQSTLKMTPFDSSKLMRFLRGWRP